MMTVLVSSLYKVLEENVEVYAVPRISRLHEGYTLQATVNLFALISYFSRKTRYNSPNKDACTYILLS